ncbi:MAG: reductive dehalogenase [Dehalococcoides mccartyi]|nr:reductive dehalogenase [Dehalococcoides mccartyi]UZH91512.1 reductive dehalogenase [uncultured bacterium]MBF4481797.1 reductive dehalogenase [Dehalococcoides mccartyi]MDP4280482.1 reductive dehalogenase [Dehalococcoides mccartyi]UZH91544.1 reductive dehalogenase [uncultured bacterium]UZH91568.1 reductive dehalogenase [uncultured bacterium]
MKTFHSTLSRRDFMKALGLAGAGIGTAAAAAPVFHDLDEVTASSGGVQKLPWWVKERDFKNPSVPIDWQNLPKMEGTFPYQARPTLSAQERYAMGIPGGSSGVWASPEQAQVLFDYMKKEFPGWDPGYAGLGDNRTTALFMATKFMRMGMWPGEINMGGKRVNVAQAISAAGGTATFTSFLGLRSSETLRPQDFGVPRWEGTPEENLLTLRQVVRFLGGCDVGAQEMDSDVFKLFHETSGGKQLVIEDVDEAAETATKLVIPAKAKYILQWTARQPYESTRRQAGEYEDAAVYWSYQRFPFVGAIIQEFIHALGYTAVSTHMAGYHTNAIATLTGLGEHCRMSSPTLVPKYGTTNRAMWVIITDMPLMATKPIDFGVYKFCQTCGICADSCPFGLIEQGDPSWEATQPGTRPGFNGWRTNTTTCPHCPVCQGSCPFNTNGDGSFIHDLVRNTVSVTPVFNSFFASMEKTMGYGRKDPRDWWNIDDYTYGINTSY